MAIWFKAQPAKQISTNCISNHTQLRNKGVNCWFAMPIELVGRSEVGSDEEEGEQKRGTPFKRQAQPKQTGRLRKHCTGVDKWEVSQGKQLASRQRKVNGQG